MTRDPSRPRTHPYFQDTARLNRQTALAHIRNLITDNEEALDATRGQPNQRLVHAARNNLLNARDALQSYDPANRTFAKRQLRLAAKILDGAERHKNAQFVREIEDEL